MEQKIMSAFNQNNNLDQKLNFLESKYTSLLSSMSTDSIEKVENFLKVSEGKGLLDIKKQGLLRRLSTFESQYVKDFLNEMFLNTPKTNLLKESLLVDLAQYKSLLQEKQQLHKDTIDGHTKGKLFSYLEQKIKDPLRQALSNKDHMLEAERTIIDDSFEEGLEDAFSDELSEILQKNFVDPIVYFHFIQSVFRKYNYVLTFEDIGRLKKILKELDEGRMLFLSGDTGSGKTELSILIADLYLKNKGINSSENRSAIIIGGNRETDLSDFSLEKVITSENYMTKSQDDVVRGERDSDDNYSKILGTIVEKDQLKQLILKDVDEGNYTSNEKVQLKEDVEKIDFEKYNIFTKYHAKGLFKAMHDGVPLIIDEMNAIRPEILIGLNHYLTRKVGQKIQLRNGLGAFSIKDGFCIMATGNDKSANKKKEMYQSRYKIDESLINRMSIVEKGYMNQEDTQYNTTDNLMNDISHEEKSLEDHMNANEIYGVLLLLFFEDTKKQKSETFNKMITSNKLGFDLMKESFVGLTSKEQKETFFSQLKQFAIFVKYIQNAYEKKGSVMCEGVDISNLINMRAISMRNIREIVSAYKKDTKSLFYHIYDKLISKGNGNEDELKGILYALKAAGLLPKEFSSGTLSLEGNKLYEIKSKLQKYFLNEKNPEGANRSLLSRHDKKIPINSELLNNRIVLTKQDIYQEYFGSQLSDIDDYDILSSDFKELKVKAEQVEGDEAYEESVEEGGENSNYSINDIQEQADTLFDILNNAAYGQNRFIQNLSYIHYKILKEIVVVFKDIEFVSMKNLTFSEVGTLFQIFNKILTKISENQIMTDQEAVVSFNFLKSLLGK